MKMRLLLAGGLLLALSGCATYDYVGGGNGYYRGTPSVQYNYPYGYPSYGYGSYPYYGGYGYYGYGGSYYRPAYRPPPRPDHRPPPPRPPRPGYNGGSPWRNMDSLTRPAQPTPSVRPPDARPSPPRMNGSPWRNMDRATQRPL